MSDSTRKNAQTRRNDSRSTEKRPDRDRDFFVWPGVGGIIFNFILLNFAWMAAFAPTSFPAILGPFARLGTYAGLNHPNLCLGLVIVICLAHGYETFETWKLCRQLQLSGSATRKWIFSTLLVGIFSLNQLKSFKEKGA